LWYATATRYKQGHPFVVLAKFIPSPISIFLYLYPEQDFSIGVGMKFNMAASSSQ
jgi:hypothetical protein